MCCVFFLQACLRPPPMLFDTTSRSISVKSTEDLSKKVGHIAIIGSRALDIQQLRPSNHCGCQQLKISAATHGFVHREVFDTIEFLEITTCHDTCGHFLCSIDSFSQSGNPSSGQQKHA